MNYKTRNEQTIFDLVNVTYGDLNNTYQLLQNNPSIESIESVPVGIEVNYIPLPVTPPSVGSAAPKDPAVLLTYRSRNNQSVYDVCLQKYGDLNFMYRLLQDSNFANLLIYPVPGTLFIFNAKLIVDEAFNDYLNKNSIVFTTGNVQQVVFGEEDRETIFISEDGKEEFTPEK